MRLTDLSRTLRHEGLEALTFRLLRASVGRVIWIERIAFYGADLTPIPCDAQPFLNLKFVLAEADDLRVRYREILEVSFDLRPEIIEKRLSHAHLAVLALHDEDPIAMVWLAFDEQAVSEIGLTLVLQANEVITYNEFVVPSWRNRGVSVSLNRFADAYAVKRFARRRITWRRLSNRPAIRVAEKLGHRLLTVATTMTLGGTWHPLVLGLTSVEPALEFRRS